VAVFAWVAPSGCILAVERARPPLRVPAVYLAHAIVAILAVDALRGINNLPVCTSHRASTPAPSTIFFYFLFLIR
jgi:hypothetical protein